MCRFCLENKLRLLQKDQINILVFKNANHDQQQVEFLLNDLADSDFDDLIEPYSDSAPPYDGPSGPLDDSSDDSSHDFGKW